jgi:hypothetical protein
MSMVVYRLGEGLVEHMDRVAFPQKMSLAHIRTKTHRPNFEGAPAGGATAAALEGSTLAGPSASPHLPVVCVGNPVAVTCLARCGAKRVGCAIPAISNFRESHVRRGFEKQLCTLPAPRSPGRPVRYTFSRRDTTRIPSHLAGWGSMYLHECVDVKRVRTNKEVGLGF